MGKCFLTIRLFISLKSLTTCIVLSFFGMMKVGEAHSESACHFNTPKLHSFWISFVKVSICFFGIGNSSHGMVVLPLSVGARPDFNPSHPVFHGAALLILVGASKLVLFCYTEVIEAILFGNCPESCLFIFGI